MKKISRKNVIIIAISLIIVLIIVILLFVKNIIIVNKVEEKSIKNGGKVEYTVKDNKAIYEEDEDGVRKIYITVAKDNKKNMGNLYRYRFHNFLTQKGKPETKPKLNVQVEFDKPSPIMAGSDVNATIEPKGHATSRAAQKSYKIKL
ncbi:spore coat protein, partial [Clostridium sp. cpc1]|nr:spore coat protein [Clostridium sp. cpc1]